MPLYEYQCQACGRRFERIQKFSDPPVDVCPTCGGAVDKLVSSPAFQFKGSGWYVTDYARKGDPGDKTKPSESGKSGDGAGESTTSKDTSEKAPASQDAPATPSTSAPSTTSSDKGTNKS